LIKRRVGKLAVNIFPDRQSMGVAAAKDVAIALKLKLLQIQNVRMVFASAPSQREMLTSLARIEGIDWSRVTVFHMDEYIGLDPTAPQRFGVWLKSQLFDRVSPGCIHLLYPDPDPERSAADYAALLAEFPIDIVCMGIGVNGHLAFNDPPVADFEDSEDVKIVQLDEDCRQQQVDDKCFASLNQVPTTAVTLTLPRLMRTEQIFCVVPGAQKKAAVNAALHGPMSVACPASILRTHANCALYLDKESEPDD